MKRYGPPLTPSELEVVRQNIYLMSYGKIADIINQGRPFHEGVSGATLRKQAIANGILRDKQRRSGVKKKQYSDQFFNPHEFAEFYR